MSQPNMPGAGVGAAAAAQTDEDADVLDESRRLLSERVRVIREQAASIKRRFSPPGGMPAVRPPTPSTPDQ